MRVRGEHLDSVSLLPLPRPTFIFLLDHLLLLGTFQADLSYFDTFLKSVIGAFHD